MMGRMPFISPTDRDGLRALFERELTRDVRMHLTVHRDECQACAQAQQVLAEIVALSDRLELDVERGSGSLPEIRFSPGRVGFVGLPTGFEFPGLVDAIVDVSKGVTSLARETLDALANVDRRVHVQVFTSPT